MPLNLKIPQAISRSSIDRVFYHDSRNAIAGSILGLREEEGITPSFKISNCLFQPDIR